MTTDDELRLEIENVDLRRLLAQAGIDAAEHKAVEQLQRILVEELHHRVKNTLATVIRDYLAKPTKCREPGARRGSDREPIACVRSRARPPLKDTLDKRLAGRNFEDGD